MARLGSTPDSPIKGEFVPRWTSPIPRSRVQMGETMPISTCVMVSNMTDMQVRHAIKSGRLPAYIRQGTGRLVVKFADFCAYLDSFGGLTPFVPGEVHAESDEA